MLLELDGWVMPGVGVSTDILEASGRTYLRALSTLLANSPAAEASTPSTRR